MKHTKIRNQKILLSVFVALFIVITTSCDNGNVQNVNTVISNNTSEVKSQQDFKATLKKHLDAVSTRDLVVLKKHHVSNW